MRRVPRSAHSDMPYQPLGPDLRSLPHHPADAIDQRAMCMLQGRRARSAVWKFAPLPASRDSPLHAPVGVPVHTRGEADALSRVRWVFASKRTSDASKRTLERLFVAVHRIARRYFSVTLRAVSRLESGRAPDVASVSLRRLAASLRAFTMSLRRHHFPLLDLPKCRHETYRQTMDSLRGDGRDTSANWRQSFVAWSDGHFALWLEAWLAFP